MIDLTPLEVRKKKGDFRRIMRGYDPALVDDFIDLVADRMDELVREVLSLKERVGRQEQQVADFRERERALTEALVTAQEMREEIRQQTSREADLVKRSAEQAAAELRSRTEQELARVRAAAEHEAAQLRAAAEQDSARLRATAQQEAAELRSSLRREREREEQALHQLRARQEQLLGSYRAFLERELAELSVAERALGLGSAAMAPVAAGSGAAVKAADDLPGFEVEEPGERAGGGRRAGMAAAADADGLDELEELAGFEPEPLEPFAPEPFEPADEWTEDAVELPEPLELLEPIEPEEPLAGGEAADPGEPLELEDRPQPEHDAMAPLVDQELAALAGAADAAAVAGDAAPGEPQPSGFELYDHISADAADDGVPGPIGLAQEPEAGADDEAEVDEQWLLLRNAAAAGFLVGDDDDELLLEDAIAEEEGEEEAGGDGWLGNLLEDER